MSLLAIDRERGSMVQYCELPLDEVLAEKLEKLKIDFAFQPIFEKKSMKIVGHEALMRPLGRTPLELIEEHRIKGGLHTLELATFFGACKAYYDRDMQGILSINSFPAECFDREESKTFFRCFPDINKQMFVEILEYTDLNFEKWVLKREQIRTNGIRISLDDYGSGNNYMMAVNIFEPDEIKIDRSLISGIHNSRKMQEHFVELVNKFHDRGAFVLAEGIECKEELDFIRTTDVDYLQGYYLGMPE